jgi:iron(III) transport system substrate-binding protein
MRRRNRPTLLATMLVLVLVLAACGDDGDATPAGTSAQARERITVYTGRHYGIEPVFKEFTAATGIEIRFTPGNDPELRARLKAEGANTPADVIMTADAANIDLAAKEGLLAKLDSKVLADAVPKELRSPDNTWFTLSQRLRVIIASTARVSDPPTTYAAVGDPKWKGKLCLRPSTHPYTQSLVASLVLAEGEKRATEIVQSWVNNNPVYINSDTDIYKAVAKGDCDIAIANTYYLGRLLKEDAKFPVRIVWPEQGGRGAHVNVSAAAVTANAPNPKAAQRLIEWLATQGQKQFTDVNFEYPADPKVKPDDLVVGFGQHKADIGAVLQLGANQAAAIKILSATGYK